jgi:hypothetical protein
VERTTKSTQQNGPRSTPQNTPPLSTNSQAGEASRTTTDTPAQPEVSGADPSEWITQAFSSVIKLASQASANPSFTSYLNPFGWGLASSPASSGSAVEDAVQCAREACKGMQESADAQLIKAQGERVLTHPKLQQSVQEIVRQLASGQLELATLLDRLCSPCEPQRPQVLLIAVLVGSLARNEPRELPAVLKALAQASFPGTGVPFVAHAFAVASPPWSKEEQNTLLTAVRQRLCTPGLSPQEKTLMRGLVSEWQSHAFGSAWMSHQPAMLQAILNRLAPAEATSAAPKPLPELLKEGLQALTCALGPLGKQGLQGLYPLSYRWTVTDPVVQSVFERIHSLWVEGAIDWHELVSAVQDIGQTHARNKSGHQERVLHEALMLMAFLHTALRLHTQERPFDLKKFLQIIVVENAAVPGASMRGFAAVLVGSADPAAGGQDMQPWVEDLIQLPKLTGLETGALMVINSLLHEVGVQGKKLGVLNTAGKDQLDRRGVEATWEIARQNKHRPAPPALVLTVSPAQMPPLLPLNQAPAMGRDLHLALSAIRKEGLRIRSRGELMRQPGMRALCDKWAARAEAGHDLSAAIEQALALEGKPSQFLLLFLLDVAETQMVNAGREHRRFDVWPLLHAFMRTALPVSLFDNWAGEMATRTGTQAQLLGVLETIGVVVHSRSLSLDEALACNRLVTRFCSRMLSTATLSEDDRTAIDRWCKLIQSRCAMDIRLARESKDVPQDPL